MQQRIGNQAVRRLLAQGDESRRPLPVESTSVPRPLQRQPAKQPAVAAGPTKTTVALLLTVWKTVIWPGIDAALRALAKRVPNPRAAFNRLEDIHRVVLALVAASPPLSRMRARLAFFVNTLSAIGAQLRPYAVKAKVPLADIRDHIDKLRKVTPVGSAKVVDTSKAMLKAIWTTVVKPALDAAHRAVSKRPPNPRRALTKVKSLGRVTVALPKAYPRGSRMRAALAAFHSALAVIYYHLEPYVSRAKTPLKDIHALLTDIRKIDPIGRSGKRP